MQRDTGMSTTRGQQNKLVKDGTKKASLKSIGRVMSKTAIIDDRVPLGKVYVDLTVDEVLEACKRYASDKAFDEELDKIYNKETSFD